MFAAGAERQAWNGFVRLSGMRLLEYLNQVTDELRRHWEDTRYLLPTLKPLMHYDSQKPRVDVAWGGSVGESAQTLPGIVELVRET